MRHICTGNISSNLPSKVTADAIQKCIDSLEDEQQKDFIRQCLVTDPASRPKARDLLFHPVLFEVTKFVSKKLYILRKESSPSPIWGGNFSQAFILCRCILSNFLQPTHSSKTQVDSDLIHSCTKLWSFFFNAKQNTSWNTCIYQNIFKMTTFANIAWNLFLSFMSPFPDNSIRSCNDEINLFPEFDMRKFGQRFLV